MCDECDDRIAEAVGDARESCWMEIDDLRRQHETELAALRADVEAFREDAANYYRVAKEADAQQAALRAELAAAHADNLCDACAGTGETTHGGTCMCGGSGKMSDAARYLRARVADLEAALGVACQLLEQDDKWRETVKLLRLRLAGDVPGEGGGHART